MADRPISSTALRAIADALDQLAQVPGRVSTIDVHGLRLTVQHRDSQRDGSWYELVDWEAAPSTMKGVRDG